MIKSAPYTWKIFYKSFEPGQEGLREALCTLANGYFGTRGCSPEAVASNVHYPGTYIAGLYNRLTTRIAGRTVTNEDFVNCPNWLFLTFRIADGEWFCPSTSKIVSYYQELNLRSALLTRRIIFEDWQGRRTLIESSILVHMLNPHIGALRYVINPLNYSDWLTIGAMLDGSIINSGVERYRKLNSRHLKPSSLGSWAKNGIFLSMFTSQSKIEVSQASKIRLFVKDKELRPKIKVLQKGKEIIGQELKIFARKNTSYQIEKVVSLYTSKDKGIQNCRSSAISLAKKVPRFKKLLISHKKVWQKLWSKVDIQIEGDTFSQKILRLHIFHLLQTASFHNIHIDAGLPARGLHGEAYRGHIFWDEVFTFPFYDLHFPQISKALLLYRYRRLPQARAYARKYGYKGAMFPWQSASSGKEETQTLHLNPLSGKWGPDYSSFQRHVSFAIAYNVWGYYQRTKDFDFLLNFGAELFLSIAHFAGSLAKYSFLDSRYHTKRLMGPDEFHEKYPNSRKPGLKDNAYSNLMIVWTLLKAKELLTLLPKENQKKLLKNLRIKEKELKLWEDITRKMNIVINKRGIISQFKGYFKLKELDWAKYKTKYRNIQRMDRILKAEGKSPDEYQVTKQADTLMFFYLFPFSESYDIFRRLGYNLDKEKIRKNYEYYVKRTTHGSSLSKVAHCLVALKLGKFDEAWHWFIEVLESDFHDTQGGTTPEGIHIGVMGGSVDLVIRGFAGISLRDDRIKIEPSLPKKWRRIKLRFCYRGIWLSLAITKKEIEILASGLLGKPFPFSFEVNGNIYHFFQGRRFRIPFNKK